MKETMAKYIYTIIFTVLMLIDWTRGSLAGAYWEVTVNCTGILFAGILLELIGLERRDAEKHAIWWMVCIVVGGIYFIPWHVDRGYLIWLKYLTIVLNVALLGSCAIGMWRRKAEFQWKKAVNRLDLSIAVIWMILMLYMCLSPMRSMWQVWFLLLFGFFYALPISSARKEQLSHGAVSGVIVGFFAIQIWAYGFRPYDVVRYTGAYQNANMNALMYMLTYVALLTKTYQWLYRGKKGKAGMLILYSVLAIGMWGFMFMTGCRTAIYCSALLTGVFVVAIIIRNRRNGLAYWKNLLRVLCVGACMPIVFVGVFLGCYATVRYLPCILHHPVWWEGDYSLERVHSFDPWDSEKYVDLDELLEMIGQRMPYLIRTRDTVDVPAENVLLVDNDSIQKDFGASPIETVLTTEQEETSEKQMESMNIRVEIYRSYFARLNWFGHELTDGYIQINEHWHAWHAQNVWLQMGFYYGIPAMILLVVLTCLTGIRYLKNAFLEIDNGWNLFSLLVWVSFFTFGTLECVWYPGQMVLFLIFFSQKRLQDSDIAIN